MFSIGVKLQVVSSAKSYLIKGYMSIKFNSKHIKDYTRLFELYIVRTIFENFSESDTLPFVSTEIVMLLYL